MCFLGYYPGAHRSLHVWLLRAEIAAPLQVHQLRIYGVGSRLGLLIVIRREWTLAAHVEYPDVPVPSWADLHVDRVQRALLRLDEVPDSRDAGEVVVLYRVLGHLAKRNRVPRRRERGLAPELLSYRIPLLWYNDRNIHPEMELIVSGITANHVYRPFLKYTLAISDRYFDIFRTLSLSYLRGSWF